LILIFSFPSGSPPALHGMHLLGTGETDLTQIESLVKVSCVSAGSPTPQKNSKIWCPIGGGEVRARDLHCVEDQVERRGPTPDGEGATEVLRGTMNV